MTGPLRLQLSRGKGANLQAASLALNGLPAVNVARPTKWGNPYRIGPTFTRDEAVKIFRDTVGAVLANRPSTREAMRAELRGKNLACWCATGASCHADVLLELANGPICDEVRT